MAMMKLVKNNHSNHKDIGASSHHSFNPKRIKQKLDFFDTSFSDESFVVEDEEEESKVNGEGNEGKLHGSQDSLFVDDLGFATTTRTSPSSKPKSSPSILVPPVTSLNPQPGTLEALLSNDKEKVSSRTKIVNGDDAEGQQPNSFIGRVFMRKKKKGLNELIPKTHNDDDDRSVGTAPLVVLETKPVNSPKKTLKNFDIPLSANGAREWTSFESEDFTAPFSEETGDGDNHTKADSSQRTATTATARDDIDESQRSKSKSSKKDKKKNKEKNNFEPKSPALKEKKKGKIRRSDMYGATKQLSSRSLGPEGNQGKSDRDGDPPTPKKGKRLKKQNSKKKLKVAAESEASDSVAVNSVSIEDELKSPPRRGTRKQLLAQSVKGSIHELNLSQSDHGNSSGGGGRPQSRGRARGSPTAALEMQVQIGDNDFNFTEDSTTVRVRSRSACAEKRFSDEQRQQGAASPASGGRLKKPTTTGASSSTKPRRSNSLVLPPPTSDSPHSSKPRVSPASSKALVVAAPRTLAVSSPKQPNRRLSWKKPPPVRNTGRSRSPRRAQSVRDLMASPSSASPRTPMQQNHQGPPAVRSRSASPGGGRRASLSGSSITPRPLRRAVKPTTPKRLTSLQLSSSEHGPIGASSPASAGSTTRPTTPTGGRRRAVKPTIPKKCLSLQLSSSEHGPLDVSSGGVAKTPTTPTGGRRRSRSSRNLMIPKNDAVSPKNRHMNQSSHTVMSSPPTASSKHHNMNQSSHTVMSSPPAVPILAAGRALSLPVSQQHHTSLPANNNDNPIVSPRSGRRRSVKAIPKKSKSLRDIGASEDHDERNTPSASGRNSNGGRRRARSSRHLLEDAKAEAKKEAPMPRFKTLSKASLLQ